MLTVIVGITIADIDVIKESFGIKHQYAIVLHGVYEGMAFRKDSASSFLLRPEFFELYQSHTKINDGQVCYVGSLRRKSKNHGGGIFSYNYSSSDDLLMVWIHVRELRR